MSFFGFRRDDLEDRIARDMGRDGVEEVVIIEETVIDDGYVESVIVIEDEYYDDSWEYSED